MCWDTRATDSIIKSGQKDTEASIKENVTESFAVTDMTALSSALLFRSESKGSGFQANGRP